MGMGGTLNYLVLWQGAMQRMRFFPVHLAAAASLLGEQLAGRRMLVTRYTLLMAGVLALGNAGILAQDSNEAEAKLEKLVKDLRHKDAKVRLAAVKALGEMGEGATNAARPLCNLLLDPSPKVVAAVLEVIEKVRPDLHADLARLLLNKDLGSHIEAVSNLGRLGKQAEPAFDLLLAQNRILMATIGKLKGDSSKGSNTILFRALCLFVDHQSRSS